MPAPTPKPGPKAPPLDKLALMILIKESAKFSKACPWSKLSKRQCSRSAIVMGLKWTETWPACSLLKFTMNNNRLRLEE